MKSYVGGDEEGQGFEDAGFEAGVEVSGVEGGLGGA